MCHIFFRHLQRLKFRDLDLAEVKYDLISGNHMLQYLLDILDILNKPHKHIYMENGHWVVLK